MEYDECTAGGMMTTEPLIVAPETPVAHCLAMISREELHAALASTVHVCRSPLETPSGRLLGIVHFQQLLRERPDRPVGEIQIGRASCRERVWLRVSPDRVERK